MATAGEQRTEQYERSVDRDVDGDVGCESDDDSRMQSPLADVLAFPSRIAREHIEPDVPLRTVVGEVLRDERHRQERTLADVATEAAVSLPYLSEIERGTKEVSSDLLSAVAGALDLTLVEVLEQCVGRLRGQLRGGSGIHMLAA